MQEQVPASTPIQQNQLVMEKQRQEVSNSVLILSDRSIIILKMLFVLAGTNV